MSPRDCAVAIAANNHSKPHKPQLELFFTPGSRYAAPPVLVLALGTGPPDPGPPQYGEVPPDNARKTFRHHPAALNGAASLTAEMGKAKPPHLDLTILISQHRSQVSLHTHTDPFHNFDIFIT